MDIQALETISMHAWPALDEHDYDGWRLRFANGYTGRSNSVYPLAASTLDLAEKIAYCEAAYAERGLIPRFKLTPAAQPAELDRELETRGYKLHTPSQMLTLDLAHLPPAAPPAAPVRITDEATLSEAWLNAYLRLSGVNPDYHVTVRALLERIEPQTIYGAAYADDQICAVTLGVRDGALIGLFDVVTHAEQRGQGIGTALTTHVLQQGQRSGAQRGYLQVLGSNATAQRLYARLGYQFSYPYWYRLKA